MAEVTASRQSRAPDLNTKPHAQSSSDHHIVDSYTGPSVHDMISTHTLAQNIIKYNSQILDDENMALLKRFVMDPDSREAILKEVHIENVEGVTGQYSGSLAGFIIMKHKSEVGETVEPILTSEEIEMLKKWFNPESTKEEEEGEEEDEEAVEEGDEDSGRQQREGTDNEGAVGTGETNVDEARHTQKRSHGSGHFHRHGKGSGSSHTRKGT